ncbi:MAG: DUF2156 domain-containing protein [Desulfobacteraceae bacterium]|nr:MAG: DUF2156 domain-containing protein [Desulfobacteraceae bacterium]
MTDLFKPIELSDREIFFKYFKVDHPGISELSFTNLFVWRNRYRPVWTQHGGCLLILCYPEGDTPFALPPVGLGDKPAAIEYLFNALEKSGLQAKICRVPEAFINAYIDPDRFTWIADRDNSDYVYTTLDLIELSGNRLHKKKNHINQFKRNNSFEYRPMDLEAVECVVEMQEEWCQLKACVENQELMSEDYAIKESLTHFEELEMKGGVILINKRVEAFSMGELLTQDTAVIHFEKANPNIQGLYAAINQLFCQNAWSHIAFINREQDLGKEGLRRAKESYRPHHMVNKFTVFRR